MPECSQISAVPLNNEKKYLILLFQEEKIDEKAESRHIRGGWLCFCLSDESDGRRDSV